MSTRANAVLLGIILAAAAVFIVVAIVIASAVGGSGGSGLGQGAPSPTTSQPPSTSDGGTDATPQQDATTGVASDAATPSIQQAAEDFLSSYASEGDTKAWTSALTPLTTPELLASITTSDRDIARSLEDARLGEPQGSDVPVLIDGVPAATIHLTQIPSSAEGGITADSPWITQYVTFATPPAGAALPLHPSSNREIADAVHPAVVSLVAQPGGLTDADRAAQIDEAFTSPTQAQKIPRVADSGTSITVGAIHDAQLGTEDGKLTALVIAPWQADGDPNFQWTTYTIVLTRAPDGTWTAADATTV